MKTKFNINKQAKEIKVQFNFESNEPIVSKPKKLIYILDVDTILYYIIKHYQYQQTVHPMVHLE